MNTQVKNMLIGVFVLAACSFAVFFIFFLKPSVGDGKKILYVRFANINKINVGTRVTFAGRPVGEVVAIRQIYDAREHPKTDTLGQIYFFELVLKVDSSVVVYSSDEISLQTSGLLGEKSIAIVPKPPPKGVTAKLISNEPFYAQSADPIENAFIQISEVADEVETTFKDITAWIEKNGEDVASAVRSFGGAMDSLNEVITTVNQEEIVKDIKCAMQNLSQAIEQVRYGIDTMTQKDFFANAADAMSNIELITQDLANGKGTLGKLIQDEDLYLKLSSIMSKANTMMNDINHYGILFHLNKAWQRTRTQRLNQLNALDTPRSFRAYFQTELDQINTSLSRISLVLEKAEESPDKERVLKSPGFQKDFYQLLQEADDLAEHLKQYNEQMMDKELSAEEN